MARFRGCHRGPPAPAAGEPCACSSLKCCPQPSRKPTPNVLSRDETKLKLTSCLTPAPWLFLCSLCPATLRMNLCLDLLIDAQDRHLKKQNRTQQKPKQSTFSMIKEGILSTDMPAENVTTIPAPESSLPSSPSHLPSPRTESVHLHVIYLQTDIPKHQGSGSTSASPDSQTENRPSYVLANLHLFHHYHSREFGSKHVAIN